MVGFTSRHLRGIADQGFYNPPVKGQYERDVTITGLFKYLRELAAKKAGDVKDAELRLKSAKAEMAEEELMKFREEYVKRDEIGPVLRNLALHQRATLQYKLEQEIAPNLPGKTPVEMLMTMQAATDSICKIFENGIVGWLDAPA